ncbi:MAG: response regulator, partial [Nitrospinota bacterium]
MTGKILIIEDETRLRTMLQRVLQSEGHTVLTAADGEEGIRCLEQESFDLVITDIMMGAVSGFDVMNHISTHTPETLV